MNPYPPLRIVVAFLVSLAYPIGGGTGCSAADRPPNIVIILADDLGYGDLGCYGHPTIRTPHLDRMASEGMRFTEFYSAAEVCTPSRAALLTGRYPLRSGMCHDQFRVLRNRSLGHLPADEITLAEALKQRGYQTACIGKWHLGVWEFNPDGHPRKHGFDYSFGLPHSNDMNPTAAAPKGANRLGKQDPQWWDAPLYRNEELIERPVDQTTLTSRYTQEAVQFIKQHKHESFFLYMPHTFPHTPLFASQDSAGKSSRGLYGDVVADLDASVGRILQTLRDEHLDEQTFVFFTSDNGPWLIMDLQGGSAGLLREGKGSTWEGGMRVPGIAWWPKTIPAGVTQQEMACSMDLFTTSLKLAGAELPTDRVIDGVDILPMLKATSPVPHAPYFFYRGTKLMAVRVGDYKAHLWTQNGYGQPQPVAHDPPLLFNVRHDPSESINVAEDHPELLEQVKQAIEEHKAKMEPKPTQLVEFLPLPKT